MPRERSDRPPVAVVGAGMAGTACARSLTDAGFPVTIFEESRGLGGRMATRRQQDHAVDHGAQYFRARTQRFVEQVAAWSGAGVVNTWQPRLLQVSRNGRVFIADRHPRYVGLPTMNAPVKALAADIEVRCEARVAAVEPSDGGLRLLLEDGTRTATYEHVIMAVPAPRAAPLLAASPKLARAASAVDMKPCLAVMLRFSRTLDVDFDAVRFDSGAVAWACRDSSKAGREGGETWVLHADTDWSSAHLEQAPGAIKRVLLDAFFSQIERPTRQPSDMDCYRWRYARADGTVEDGCLYDPVSGLGACGDWAMGRSNVENAYLSGRLLAERILEA